MDRESLDKLVGKTIESVDCDFRHNFQDELSEVFQYLVKEAI